jgi:hemolysin activation/secretion protein
MGMNFILDGRDMDVKTKDGFYLNLGGQYTPDVLNNNKAYSKAMLDSRFYYTPGFFPVTLVNRFYAEKIWGDYYLYDAAILGGTEILRGFTRERFAGDAALFMASEIRMPVARLNIVIPGVLGLSAHAESGRVFYKNDNSDMWHPAAGAGLWLSYLHEAITLNFTGSQSSEGLQIYFNTGFMF